MNIRKNSRPILLICKSTLILLALILALMAVSTPGYAQPSAAEADFTAVDDYLESQRQALDIPGMAVSIVQGAQVAYLGSYGAADSDGRPVTPQTPFQIGSTTKSFTALAVMQLVETGLVELDAPIVPAAVALLWIGWSVFRFIRRSKRTPRPPPQLYVVDLCAHPQRCRAGGLGHPAHHPDPAAEVGCVRP